MSGRRVFSPREVDEHIPRLEAMFQHIEMCKSRAKALSALLFRCPSKSGSETPIEVQTIQMQLEFLMEAIQEDIDDILSWGGVTQDVEEGLVDFPGVVDGRDVWLSWKKGETHLRFWRALDQNPAHRRVLPRKDLHTTVH